MWINKKLGRVIAVTACVVSVVVGGASIGGAEQVGPRVSNVHKDTWLDQYHPNSVSAVSYTHLTLPTKRIV